MIYIPHMFILALVLIFIHSSNTITSEQEYTACMYGSTQTARATMTQKQFNKKREEIRQEAYKLCMSYKESK